jgi:glycogen operon protein
MTSPAFGATVTHDDTHFAVWSGQAERIDLCLYAPYDPFAPGNSDEIARLPMQPDGDGVFRLSVDGIGHGHRYGFRADGRYDPPKGCWFDPSKLLMDPYAVGIDWPYRYNALMAAPRWQHADTAPMMPKAVVTALPEPVPHQPPVFRQGGLIYELNVKAFTKLHPDVPEEQRGTLAALTHPAIIAHLKKIGVSAVELMPVTAWIDERHLLPLGLTNAWGYNPVSMMVLDPRLAPGGIADLRTVTAALRQEGIGVILDVVFNHTGESDAHGPTLSLRGLDHKAYYRHDKRGKLINDTGTGNTLACDHPRVRELIVASLRHFVLNAGVDGFRFDLAPILGRTKDGFDPNAETLRSISTDPVLADRILIAEPWDIGPDGYQLGNFPANWLEWNDRFRDDARKFWRGDQGMVGPLATRLAGSSDIFGRRGGSRTRSINYVASHDGFTLADITAYKHKHNEANGEKNRDGHNDNLSWNNGVEGPTDDEKIDALRRRDVGALLATLFASRGTIMLTAGDEFGRSQRGNNNAYCQDNAISWVDWQNRDRALEDWTSMLARVRAVGGFEGLEFFHPPGAEESKSIVEWLDFDWKPMTDERWNDRTNRRLVMVVAEPGSPHAAVLINGDRRAVIVSPVTRHGMAWRPASALAASANPAGARGSFKVAGRSVMILTEQPAN